MSAKLYTKKLSIPFILTKANGDSERNFAYLTLQSPDPIDRRLVKKTIRKWVKVNLQRSIHPRELHALMKNVYAD